MYFNSSDKSNSIIADIDFLLFGTSETFNDAYTLVDRTRNVNIVLDETVAEMFKADPNWDYDDTSNTNFPIATTDLNSGQDNYSFPDSTLVINRVRIKDSQGNLVTLEPVSRAELSDTELRATGSPNKFYKKGGSFFPVPIPDYGYDEGVEVEFQRGANHFASTDTTVSPGFNSLFHQILSVGAALRYAVGNGMREKVSFLSGLRAEITKNIREHYQTRSKDEKPRITLRRSSRGTGL